MNCGCGCGGGSGCGGCGGPPPIVSYLLIYTEKKEILEIEKIEIER